MGVEHLPVVIPVRLERDAGSRDDHPMRKVTREVAFDPASWTPERKAEVAALFDSEAPNWHTREVPGRYDALLDALDRGGVSTDGPALELGSGTGLSTPLLRERFPKLIAGDLAIEMLRLAPADVAPRLQCDSTALPFADGALQVVLAINMLLFPDEVARVIAPDGVLVWVNTSGAQTPIHLPAEDVATAMGDDWTVTASEAGTGTWAVARRTPVR
jgi:SAM-dependent methyltransferase